MIDPAGIAAQLIENITTSDIALGMTSGAMVAGAIAWVGWTLRSVPGQIWNAFKHNFVLTMTVYHDDAFYRYAAMWLSKHMNPKRSRNVSVGSTWDEEKEEEVHALIPGPGRHLIRFGARFWLVHRDVEKSGDKENSWLMKRAETLTIQTIGRDQSVLRELMQSALASFEDLGTIPVFFWNSGRYEMAGRRAKRSLDTIYMDETQKQELIADVEEFLSKRAWYAERGIPWRRGYLLEGPPGTGKTSLIFAIASLLGKPVHIINPSTLLDDNSLMEAINAAGAGMVVIEDIDSVKILEDRSLPVAADGKPNERRGITLSGFLNAIDGLASQEGRLLFITSNHADRLDAALLRPGRIDRREHLGLANMEIAMAMFRQNCPDDDPAAWRADIAPKLPLAPAAVQNLLLQRERDNAVAAQRSAA